MKEEESLLDVLVYLFEHYFYDEPTIAHDRDSLQASLVQAGFTPTEILKAFNWLDELEQRRPNERTENVWHGGPVRVYATQELDRLDNECRGFLMFLEQSGVLNAEQRELVIDRCMALELEEVDLADLKWVVLMVLFNQPGQEAAFAWIESELLEDGDERPH
jgi:Smg protein